MMQDLLIARVGGERFAVPAIEVQSVIEIGAIVPVPRAPAYIAGLTTQRSRTLTVIDVALALDLPRSEGRRSFALVIELGGVGYALAVDAVENVVAAEGDVQPTRVKLAPGWSHSARGVVETVVGTVLLVDIVRLVGSELEQEAAWQ